MKEPVCEIPVAGLDLASYRLPMAKRSFLVLTAFALLLGCGDGATTFEAANPQSESLPTSAAPAEVEVLGTLAGDSKAAPLVFVFADLPETADLADSEPVTVGAVGANGHFSLSVPPAAKLTLVFLADTAHDGAIDTGDPTAILVDPERSLESLQGGDRVLVSDIEPDFAGGKAVAAGFTVERSAAAEPAPTPTPA